MAITPEPNKVKLRILERATEGIGFQVWGAARALCHHFEEHSALVRGRRVLELGCGPGLAGLVCAHLGGDVTLTDLAHVLPLTSENVRLNPLPPGASGALRVTELPWGTDARQSFVRGHNELIIGSDITYFEHLHQPLLLMLLQLADDGTDVVLAHSHRRDSYESWRSVFESYFDIETLASWPAGPPDWNTVDGSEKALADTVVKVKTQKADDDSVEQHMKLEKQANRHEEIDKETELEIKAGQIEEIEEAAHVEKDGREAGCAWTGASCGGASYEGTVPVTVFRLRLRRPTPADSEVDRLLRLAANVDKEALLARLAQLERDLENIEAES
eukprot:TRINITY_DN12654_c0_g1_i1.p1 TRINITY_DN12654_c0_g1~~TRINITY_DN12654_c0_g1_i1.p1  ORF type:complete len:331 (+),score=65.88 TRINITY_DN12654_c0_g1_i1:166-1158(+)